MREMLYTQDIVNKLKINTISCDLLLTYYKMYDILCKHTEKERREEECGTVL